jgi:hypothetical protein
MEDSINIAKLLDLYNAQTGTVNILWNIYVVVSLGVLGFVLKEKDLRENRAIKWVFSIGFCLFAFGNLAAITRSQEILVAISETIRAASSQSKYPSVLEAFKAQNVFVIQRGHCIISFLVVVAIWLPNWIERRREAAKLPAGDAGR